MKKRSTMSDSTDRRRAERKPLKTEFVLVSDVLKAKAMDISDTGVRLVSDGPIHVSIPVEEDNGIQERTAQLVWVRKRSNGGMAYGFEFLTPEK